MINASKSGKICIGKGTIIAANTYIIDSNHGIKKGILIQSQSIVSSLIEIGDGCWIGANCVIAKGSALGNGVVIGAGSFVNCKCVDNSVYAGAPAKFIKNRE